MSNKGPLFQESCVFSNHRALLFSCDCLCFVKLNLKEMDFTFMRIYMHVQLF